MSELTKTILIVDDEERTRRLLRIYLEKEGYMIEEAVDGETALLYLFKKDYDLIIMEIMLPGLTGIELCDHIRQDKSTPIMILTSKGEEEYLVKGFKVGADDYIVKPFNPREIIYRVKALLRRSPNMELMRREISSNNLVFSHFSIECDAHRVRAAGNEVYLTPKEFELLYHLANRPDKVITREELLNDIWKNDNCVDLRTVDTHIKRIREKLNKVSPEAALMIKTIWGVGYLLKFSFE